jgi:MFS family permease
VSDTSPADTRARFGALFALYLVPGLALSSWITRTPAIRDALGATTAGMGLLFFCLAAGSMIGVLAATPLVLRVGTRATITATLALWIGGTLAIALGTELGLVAPVAAGLVAFGLGLGSAEIAFNIDGADVERLRGRPTLPYLHGAFSLGTVIGGTGGILATALGISAVLQLVVAATIAAVVALIAVRLLPHGYGRSVTPTTAYEPTAQPRWLDSRIIRIGAVVLVLALAEGTANDWLPLVMVDGHGLDESSGSLVYTTFAAAMTVGRIGGPRILAVVPRVAVVAGSATLAGLGILGIVLAASPALAYAAVVLWGLGAALAFPVCISAAGEGYPATSARRVGAVAATGYIGFLAGPAALGLLGEHVGIRLALLAVLALVAIAAALSPAVRPVASQQDETAQQRED